MLKKSWLIGGSFIIVVFTLFALFARRSVVSSPDRIAVVGSFFPVAHFAEQVGGDKVSVTTITPAGAEPHDFEPTALDIVKINQAKLFIYNGNGLDSWADKAKADVLAEGGKVLKMSEAMTNLQDGALLPDPHFWLDPVLAEREVSLIRDALSEVDPVHADYYNDQASRYNDQLAALDQEYRTGLANCQLHDIVTAHAAFGYLAREYGLNQIAIADLSPDQEPSPQKLTEIVDLARAKHIQAIFFEELVSPKLSETIAREIGASTIVFDPIEGVTSEESRNGESYLSKMRSNLSALRTALVCQ